MNYIKSHIFFKVISVILILTLLSLDASYAYPLNHNTKNSTLALPIVSQANPVNEFAARFKESVFNKGPLLSSVFSVAGLSFGDSERNIPKLSAEKIEDFAIREYNPVLSRHNMEIMKVVPVSYAKEQNGDALTSALNDIEFKGNLPGEDVVFILYRIGDKRALIQVALKDKVRAENLPGYEWSISDKYLVKYIKEDYIPDTAKTMVQYDNYKKIQLLDLSGLTSRETEVDIQTGSVLTEGNIAEVKNSGTDDTFSVISVFNRITGKIFSTFFIPFFIFCMNLSADVIKSAPKDQNFVYEFFDKAAEFLTKFDNIYSGFMPLYLFICVISAVPLVYIIVKIINFLTERKNDKTYVKDLPDIENDDGAIVFDASSDISEFSSETTGDLSNRPDDTNIASGKAGAFSDMERDGEDRDSRQFDGEEDFEAVAVIYNIETVPAMLKYLLNNKEDIVTRRKIPEMICKIQGSLDRLTEKDVKDLIDLYISSTDAELRDGVSFILSMGLRHHSHGIVSGLLISQENFDPKVRLYAIRIFSSIYTKDNFPFPLFVKLLDDPDDEVRRYAFEIFKRYDTKRLAKALEERLRDEASVIRRRAAFSLKELGWKHEGFRQEFGFYSAHGRYFRAAFVLAYHGIKWGLILFTPIGTVILLAKGVKWLYKLFAEAIDHFVQAIRPIMIEFCSAVYDRILYVLISATKKKAGKEWFLKRLTYCYENGIAADFIVKNLALIGIDDDYVISELSSHVFYSPDNIRSLKLDNPLLLNFYLAELLLRSDLKYWLLLDMKIKRGLLYFLIQNIGKDHKTREDLILRFLAKVFTGDPQCRNYIIEFFGYKKGIESRNYIKEKADKILRKYLDNETVIDLIVFFGSELNPQKIESPIDYEADLKHYMNKAELYKRNGYIAQAEIAYRKAIELNLKNDDKEVSVKAYYAIGDMYVLPNVKNYGIAINSYQECLRLDPGNISVMNNLGACFYEIGNFMKAREMFERIIRTQTDFYLAYRNLGDIYIILGDFETAVQMFAEAVRVKVKSVGSDKARLSTDADYAELCKRLANTKKVLSFYEQGILNIQSREYNEAIGALKKAVKILPYFTPAYEAMAEAYRKKGDLGGMADNYSKAVKINMGRVEAILHGGIGAGQIISDASEGETYSHDSSGVIRLLSDYGKLIHLSDTAAIFSYITSADDKLKISDNAAPLSTEIKDTKRIFAILEKWFGGDTKNEPKPKSTLKLIIELACEALDQQTSNVAEAIIQGFREFDLEGRCNFRMFLDSSAGKFIEPLRLALKKVEADDIDILKELLRDLAKTGDLSLTQDFLDLYNRANSYIIKGIVLYRITLLYTKKWSQILSGFENIKRLTKESFAAEAIRGLLRISKMFMFNPFLVIFGVKLFLRNPMQIICGLVVIGVSFIVLYNVISFIIRKYNISKSSEEMSGVDPEASLDLSDDGIENDTWRSEDLIETDNMVTQIILPERREVYDRSKDPNARRGEFPVIPGMVRDEGMKEYLAIRVIHAKRGVFPKIQYEDLKTKELNQSPGVHKGVRDLFDIVYHTVVSKRKEYLSLTSSAISSLNKGKVSGEKDFIAPVVESDTSLKAKTSIEKLMQARGSAAGSEVRAIIEKLNKEFPQFAADGAVSAILALAIKNRERKFIIAYETSWIPGIGEANNQNKGVLDRLLNELKDSLRSMGLDNVEIVGGSGLDIVAGLNNSVDNSSDMSNVIIIASDAIVDDIIVNNLLNGLSKITDNNKRPFFAAIDPRHLLEEYNKPKEYESYQLYVKLSEILYLTLEIAAGATPPDEKWIHYNIYARMLLLVPLAEVIDYGQLRKNHTADLSALKAA